MISVIVPVRNSIAWLEQVVDALLAQDYPRDGYEIILVDNGSSDGSREWLAGRSGIRVLDEPERGSYAARNRGLRHARGDILAFTDSDCFAEPGWLSAIAEGFRAARVQVLLGPRFSVGPSRAARLLADYENHRVETICAMDDPAPYFGYTNNMAVRSAAMERCGPFQQRQRGADTLLLQKVLADASCEAVAWCAGMAVRHAELDSAASYFRKARIYGRSHRAFREQSPVRTLRAAERWRVFRSACPPRRPLDAILLLALLTGGSLAWWAGRRGL